MALSRSEGAYFRGRANRHCLHFERLEDRQLLAVVTVDTVLDVVDAGDGFTSLREAISATNAMSGPDQIAFDFDGPATILLEQGEFEISEALSIIGDGPDLLTIDAQEDSRIFDITAVTGNFTVAGMSLTGGQAIGGGGAVRSMTTGKLTIQNSLVSGNSTTGGGDGGGGVSAVGDVTIDNSTFLDNTAGVFGAGGGISGSAVTVSDSTISENSALVGGGIRARGDVTVTSSTISQNSGGGIYSYINNTTYTTVTVTGSTISGNSTGVEGGGIRASFVTVTSSTISGNSATSGGGLRAYIVTVRDSEISGNSAGRFGGPGLGGGIFGSVLPGSVNVTGSTISGNSAAYGGGISGSGTVTSSTVAGNSAVKYGGGIIATNLTVNSSIVAGNTDDGTAPDLRIGSGTLSVDDSLIGDNTGTSLTEAPIGTPDADGNLVGGPTNGSIDPLLGPLANNGGPTQTHALLPGSPAIDAGDPSALAGMSGVPDFDQRGEPFTRVADGDGSGTARIDMGAFEQLGMFVVDTLVDESDGDFSEDDLSLREAIEQANTTASPNIVMFDSELFASAQTMLLELGELEITELLSIEGPGPDLLTIDGQELSRVFNITAESGDFAIAGMTLTGGRTTGDTDGQEDDTFRGGAIRSTSAGTLTIQESTITSNSTADAGGGGIFAAGNVAVRDSAVRGNSVGGKYGGGGILATGNVSVDNSTISDNHVPQILGDTGGGGIAAKGSVTVTDSVMSENSALSGGAISASGEVSISSTIISSNSSGIDGGGISAAGNVSITASTVTENSALSNGDGGGISSSGNVEITSSTISGNSANGIGIGGGIRAEGDVTVAASTISDNSAHQSGGIWSGGDVSVIASTVSGNVAKDRRGGIYGGNVSVLNSTISNNRARYTGGVNAAVEMTIESSTITGNSADEAGGISNFNGSVEISNSIVAGNSDNGQAPDILVTVGPLEIEYSLIGDNTGTGLTEASVGSPDADGNLIGGPTNGAIDPLLGLLNNNGGPTQTHALLLGSPAIDAGDPLAMAGVDEIAEYDQRGAHYSRVADGGAAVRMDMGAFEVPDTFVVDTLVDESDGDFSAGDLSLREAIEQANEDDRPNNIAFDPMLFPSAQSLMLVMGELEITELLTVSGPGQDLLTIDAQEQSRILNVTADTGDFAIAGVTLSSGKTIGDNVDVEDNSFSGGAVRSLTTGNLSIHNSHIAGSSTTGMYASGGGVFATGDVTLTSSLVTGNSTEGTNASGGGVVGRHVTIRSSTVSGNSSDDFGGGVNSYEVVVTDSTISDNTSHNGPGGGLWALYDATVESSTISHNSATRGGGIQAFVSATVTRSTIYGNSAETTGGGISTGDESGTEPGIATVRSSIVAGNNVGEMKPDLSSSDLSVQHSLIGDNSGTSLVEAPVGAPDADGNLIGGTSGGVIDPLLGPLSDNGGSTLTHALMPGSPAIDAGDPLAWAGVDDTPETDQRGSPFTRVYDGDGADGDRIDVGAFELQPQAGDLNGDLSIDFGDLSPFVDALTDPETYEATYPDLDRVFLCDVSGDGACDFGDLGPFTDLLTGGEVGRAASLGDQDSLQPATVWGDVPPVPSQRPAHQRRESRVTSETTGSLRVRDLALMAWLSSIAGDETDEGSHTTPHVREGEEQNGRLTDVVTMVGRRLI